MKKPSYFPKFIIAILLLFIGMLFFFSIDRYKVSHDQWIDKITNLKIISNSLTNSLLKFQGNLRSDYARLDKQISKLSEMAANFNTHDLMGKRQLFIKQKQISLPTEKISNIIDQQLKLIASFKLDFSTLKNAESAVFQLIANFKQENADDEDDLIHEIESLERRALYVIRFPENAKYKQKMQQKIDAIKNEYLKQGKGDINNLLETIIKHFNTIINYRETIKKLVKQKIDLTEELQYELESLQQKLEKIYRPKHKKSLNFWFLFLIIAISSLVFAIFQSIKNRKLTMQLFVQNQILEDVIKQKTKNLKSTEDKLQIEKQGKKDIQMELDSSKGNLDTLMNHFNGCVFGYNIANKRINYISKGVEGIWGIAANNISHADTLKSAIHADDINEYNQQFDAAISNKKTLNIDYRIIKRNTDEKDKIKWVREMSTLVEIEKKKDSILSVIVDVSEFKQVAADKKRIEEELIHAQKLESVGQLAAGVAHEINTPAQFISDNLVFLQEAVDEIFQFINDVKKNIDSQELKTLSENINTLFEEADINYLSEEVPTALKQSFEGISRVAKIVRAMKDYSHPGETMQLANINEALESTIIVSGSEWKYFAKLETEFADDLPMVECVIGDINQVVLNMIVNAGHAIVERFDDPDKLEGLIKVTTKKLAEQVAIEISDNGNGMSEEVKTRIFDQFFTTKEVGKGTGQGLSIAYRLIADKHKGKIEVDSEPGQGTTFRIILPIEQKK